MQTDVQQIILLFDRSFAVAEELADVGLASVTIPCPTGDPTVMNAR